MLRLWYNIGMLAIEAQQVLWLRTFKLAAGGRKANAEAERMVTEKTKAATAAAGQLMRGGSAQTVVNGYRRKVRANRRRLAK